MAESHAEVWVQIGAEDVLAGPLWSRRQHGRESATFAYDTSYLRRAGAYELDPALPLMAGPFQTGNEQKIFAAFSDCAPDRWGRRLIERHEQQRAESEGGAERSFGEADYLLEVRDDLRQGALRFRDPSSGIFLADDDTGVPPLIGLPELLSAAESLERNEANEDELRTLLRGGSSLGGARPKAHILDSAGRVAIAKFPSTNDEWDVIRWEAVALKLADDAGIWVPDRTLEQVDGKPVLILDRFDRDGQQRVGYVSAMTMLEATDGDRRSYVELAAVIDENSPTATADLRQLWRRVAFTILISNTDDHLRNHGFLRSTSAGWSLSPAFDINPDPRPGPKYLSTAIDRSDEPRLDSLIQVAPVFGVEMPEARGIVGDVLAATSKWQKAASGVGLSKTDIERMASAFEHPETARAKQIAAGDPIPT